MTLQLYSIRFGLKTPCYSKLKEKRVLQTVKTKSNQQAVPIPFYFFGLKHCGKSTLGRITAHAFSMNFLDADDILNNFLSKKPNYKSMSIRELYHTKGKQKFQEYEYQSMVENLEYKLAISDSSSSKSINTIYALGGGACDNTPLLQFLKQTLGTFFYIKQDEKVLLNRILQSGIPPFLDNKNPEGSFHKLFTARSNIYEEQADHIIDISGKQPIEDSVRIITTYLKKLKL
jgi:shikimate kinase